MKSYKKLVYFFQWVVEILLQVSYPLTSLLPFILPLYKITDKHSHPIPLIIVEHWFRQNVYHIFMKWYLEKKGFQVHMFNFSLFRGGVEEGASKLKEFIEKRNIEKCVLIGISAGAVTAYTYAQRYKGWEKVVKLISVGAPFHGTPLTFAFPFLKSARQLRPMSSFVKELKKEKNQYPSRIVCISSKYDELVPSWSSKLPNTRHLELDIAGHNNLHIWSSEVFKLVAKEAFEF